MNINVEPGTYAEKRIAYYAMIDQQLDALYHDIDTGKLGADAKTGTFYLHRKAVKEKYPKS